MHAHKYTAPAQSILIRVHFLDVCGSIGKISRLYTTVHARVR